MATAIRKGVSVEMSYYVDDYDYVALRAANRLNTDGYNHGGIIVGDGTIYLYGPNGKVIGRIKGATHGVGDTRNRLKIGQHR